MAEQFCGREETHGPHGECNGGMFSSGVFVDDWVTMCAAGDGPIVLRDGEAMVASSTVDLHSDDPETVVYWHRHCYDLAHVPPARRVTPESSPAFEVWVTKWFADHLTSDTFKHLGDEEFAALLAKDMTEAKWFVRHG